MTIGLSNGALTLESPLSLPNGGSGASANKSLVDMVYTSISSVVTCNTAISITDTIPTSSDGNEVLTLAITPKNASNILEISSIVTGASNGGTGTIAVCVFKDSESSSRAVTYVTLSGSYGTIATVSYRMVAGSTSSTTFKIRCGGALTFYVNGGNAGGRLFGGVSSTTLSINEYSV